MTKVVRSTSLLGLAMLLLDPLPACREQGDALNRLERDGQRGVYTDYAHIRSTALDQDQDPDRYLGRSFDKLGFTAQDVQGFLPNQVLDLSRLASGNPWSPFGEALPTSAAPRVRAQAGKPDTLSTLYEALGGDQLRDTLSLDLGGGYKPVQLSYPRQSSTSRPGESYLCRALRGYKYSYRRYDIQQGKDYGFYLDGQFVRDLRRLSASELIDKYGTHIVTSYSIGASQELTVVANSSFFTSEEVRSITGALWTSKGALSPQLEAKVSQHRDQMSLSYLQAGSDYTPPSSFVRPANLFRGGQRGTHLDSAAFGDKASREGKAFFELEGANISIPSIIHSLPLRVKYTCGILDRIRPGGQPSTMYVLSDPSTYQRVPYQSSFLNIMLSKYQDTQVYVYIGPSAYHLLQEEGGQGNRQTRWQASINEDGLWTLQSIHSKKYLCRDLKTRTLAEDTSGLRYWGLNPSVTTSKDSNPYALSSLLIQR